MRCAVCDDDYAWLRGFGARLAAWCEKRGIVCDARFFLNPAELLIESIDTFDLVFLNVDMGCWDGINIARSIREAGSNTLIIFVSAHLRYATEGYVVGAFRYLLKDNLDETFEPAMDAALAHLSYGTDTVDVKCGKEQYRLPLSSILYVESDKRVLTFVLGDGPHESLRCYRKLSDLEAELAGKGFLRIHKSYLVNLRYIDAIKNYTAYFKDGSTLQTSRRGYSALTQALRDWKAGRKKTVRALPSYPQGGASP